MTIDTSEMTQRIAGKLEALAEVGDHAGMKTIVSEIRDERLPALREGQMSMVVLGEFNHGKSTVINALLGKNVLPTGITPTTSVITHIKGGDDSARVVRDDTVDEVGADELSDVIVKDAPNDLRFVELHVDSPLLSDGLMIVDTPGVNDISKQKVEITYGYVPRADVIIYVLDATQALKRSEITFIEERLLKNSKDRVFFALGKVDALDDAELDEIRVHVKERLSELVGDVPLFPLSARRALAGGDEGFDAFKDAIEAYVHAQKAEIILESAARTGMRLASLIDQSLAIEMGAVALADEELQERVEKVRAKLSKSRMMIRENVLLIEQRAGEIATVSRENVREFVAAFTDALPREVGRARVEDLKRYLPDFIHDTFKEWVEKEGTHVAMQLEKLAEDIISITNRNMKEAVEDVNEELGLKTRDLNFEVDTFGYDVGVFAVLSLGVTFLALSNVIVGGLLTLSAPVLAFVLKDKVDGKVRERAIEQGTSAIQKAGEKLQDELGMMIGDFADRLKLFVEEAGDRLYRQVVEALDRVIADRKKGQQNHEEVREILNKRRGLVNDIASDLREIREGLRAG